MVEQPFQLGKFCLIKNITAKNDNAKYALKIFLVVIELEIYFML